MLKERRLEFITEFLDDCFESCRSLIQHSVSINEDSEDHLTDFEVKITNTTNDKQQIHILRYEDGNGISNLIGDDFYPVLREDFIIHCFLDEFLTHIEN